MLCMLLLSCTMGFGQDRLERAYFPRARAKNAAIAAARYAEEGYYYTKFTTFVSAVDSSRIFADTALFFVKRSLMLGDTSLTYAPTANREAIQFLREGKSRVAAADSVIRGFYPLADLRAHRQFGQVACFHLSNGVMDFFNASLLLGAEPDAPKEVTERYSVLPFADEVVRLEADETSFQHAANQYEADLAMLNGLAADIMREINATADQKTRYKLRTWYDEVQLELRTSSNNLQDAHMRIREIRNLLDRKHLEDVKDVVQPEHLSYFETKAAKSAAVAMNETVPEGLVYKIQLGYYPPDVDVKNFKGLYPITAETVRTDLARFYAGMFFSYADASKGSDYVRNNAIPNAFIVPFYNGRKISMSRAVEIEKGRGVK